MPAHDTDPSASWEYCLSVPNDLRAVTVSRRTLRLILTLHGLIGLVDAAELLATELISNAVLHTEGPAALRVRYAGGTLRIGAWDTDPEPPEPPDSPEPALRRTAAASSSSAPARTTGAGTPCPATATVASTSGAN